MDFSKTPYTYEPTSLESAHNTMDDVRDERSTRNAGLLYLFILVCLLAASMWCLFSVRNYRSDRVVPQTTKNDEGISLEEEYDKVIRTFETFGNRTVLNKDNFKTGDVPGEDTSATEEEVSEEIMVDSSESPKAISIATDLEAGQGDGFGLLIVQRKNSDTEESTELIASNCCAICLESYNPGETVAWSMDNECNHLYHQFCLATTFAHAKKKGLKCRCPTCRRNFFTTSKAQCDSS